MGEQLARVLAGSGLAELVVVNRTPAAAEVLATELGARTASLSALVEALDDVDLCVTCTGAPVAILDPDDLAAASERRAGRPLLVVDVAVPRNVLAADFVPGLTLLDIDDVRRFVGSNLDDRRREAERARGILDDQLDEYVAEATAREVAPLVLTMRQQAEAVRRAELDRLAGRLAGLDDRQRATVEALTKGIVAKLLHEPTVRLKDAAGTARGERLAETLRELFDL